MTPAEEQRGRHRRTARDCAALIDLLIELYPPTALPALNASEREVGAWMGERRLIQRLEALRQEASKDGVPTVLGG